ncbi:homeobox protein Hox-C4 isoform X4 [Acomys russatus]|uniref:homeobox protein Hox-C4 isoform X4 n=1 Tax=Acomys russatus TaxID=60746 RepID=UPI0021E2E8FE|nr:homeobox protein Hox-C4 isoform X4 [Acomys russatus]
MPRGSQAGADRSPWDQKRARGVRRESGGVLEAPKSAFSWHAVGTADRGGSSPRPPEMTSGGAFASRCLNLPSTAGTLSPRPLGQEGWALPCDLYGLQRDCDNGDYWKGTDAEAHRAHWKPERRPWAGAESQLPKPRHWSRAGSLPSSFAGEDCQSGGECNEYSQNSYIPEHSPEYYGRTRESGFQHHHQELYPPPPPRPSYPERQYSCTSLQGPGNSRAHGPAQAGHHHPEKSQPLCEPAPLSGASASPSPAPPACSQPAPDHPSSAASKQPIVYPWMKKIHVSTGATLG